MIGGESGCALADSGVVDGLMTFAVSFRGDGWAFGRDLTQPRMDCSLLKSQAAGADLLFLKYVWLTGERPTHDGPRAKEKPSRGTLERSGAVPGPCRGRGSYVRSSRRMTC